MMEFKIIIVLLAIYLTAIPASGLNYGCPSEDPDPCVCVEAYGKVFLRCTSLQNRQQLMNAFRVMSGYDVTQLEIENSNLTHIPHDLFRNSTVARLRVKNSMMFYLFDRDLQYSADSITEITLENIEFEGGLDWSVLENLEKLQILVVNGSDIEQIYYDASELKIPLESLFLSNNGIKFIYEYAFQNLKDLKILKLDNNLLSKLNRSMLPQPTSGVQFLDFSFNRLTSLPSDMFEGITELHTLILRGNVFNVLEKTYMEKVFPNLFYFDVEDNPLKCSCELSWILSEKRPYHVFGSCTHKK
ncbi:Immunoglobulin superfamily containing leucine-rich repeat protein, partial [Stegodyphus mimosarum]